jgi:hypothetical protein
MRLEKKESDKEWTRIFKKRFRFGDHDDREKYYEARKELAKEFKEDGKRVTKKFVYENNETTNFSWKQWEDDCSDTSEEREEGHYECQCWKKFEWYERELDRLRRLLQEKKPDEPAPVIV